jgi:hypothetical protein
MRIIAGIPSYAAMTVLCRGALAWEFTIEIPITPVLTRYTEAIYRGLKLAAAEHEKRGGPPHHIKVIELLQTAVDTSNDSVECAAAGATWNALGHDENDLVFTFSNRTWRVDFRLT